MKGHPVVPAALPRRSGRRLARNRGSALFLLLILAVVMATIMGGIYAYISTSAKFERRSNVRTEATYAAEYAFETARQQLNTLLATSSQIAPDISNTTTVTNLSTAPTSAYGASNGYTWQSFLTVPVEDGYVVDKFSNFSPTGGVYKYLTIVEFTRKVGNLANGVHMQFQREWDYQLTPLFQYAIFYDNNMELFPGAAFVVGGKVHSNATIYTGTSASIEFKDKVTYVNGIQYNYSPDDPRAQGGLNKPVYDISPNPTSTTRQQPPGASTADLTDTNHNNDGPRELIEVPDIHSTDPLGDERLYTEAGIKVLVNTSGGNITSDSGVVVPAHGRTYLTKDGTQITDTNLTSYLDGAISTPSATPTSSYQIYDYREGATMTTTNVSGDKLATYQSAGGLPEALPNSATWPSGTPLSGKAIPSNIQGKDFWNGIVYVADVSNSSTHRAAVRIQGATLPSGSNTSSPVAGLTVVTPNAAYIQGDYNTGGSPPVDSGTNLSANNYASGYTVQPAAVMADAITILSNSWSNSYTSSTSLSSRTPSNTTVNTALISGIVQSTKTGTNAAYSGGVENYLRLLENWSGKRLTYYGSMVNLYTSQQSTAKWITTGTYYNAPTRNWYFDIQFLDPNRLPPGTPIVRTLLPGQWAQIE